MVGHRATIGLVGFAVISQGATCHPPITPLSAMIPVPPAMQPARSVSVSAVGGIAIGDMAPRFDEMSRVSGGGVGGGARVSYQPTEDFGLALSAGAATFDGLLAATRYSLVVHGTLEARWRVASQHSVFVGAGGGAQAWDQTGPSRRCAMTPCMDTGQIYAPVLSPIASAQVGFGATWIRRPAADWYSNVIAGFTYGTSFVVSGDATRNTVTTIPDFSGMALLSTGVRVTLARSPESRTRVSLLADVAALARTEPLIGGVATLGLLLELDGRGEVVRLDDVRAP